MKAILMVAACAALLVAVGCKKPTEFPPRIPCVVPPDSIRLRLVVDDRPLADSEQWRTWYVMLLTGIETLSTRWGKLHAKHEWKRSEYSMEKQMCNGRVIVTIDGVDDVREPGRWWRVVREKLNSLLDSMVVQKRRWEASLPQRRHDESLAVAKRDSSRRFKLDSAMTAIGR